MPRTDRRGGCQLGARPRLESGKRVFPVRSRRDSHGASRPRRSTRVFQARADRPLRSLHSTFGTTPIESAGCFGMARSPPCSARSPTPARGFLPRSPPMPREMCLSPSTPPAQRQYVRHEGEGAVDESAVSPNKPGFGGLVGNRRPRERRALRSVSATASGLVGSSSARGHAVACSASGVAKASFAGGPPFARRCRLCSR